MAFLFRRNFLRIININAVMIMFFFCYSDSDNVYCSGYFCLFYVQSGPYLGRRQGDPPASCLNMALTVRKINKNIHCSIHYLNVLLVL